MNSLTTTDWALAGLSTLLGFFLAPAVTRISEAVRGDYVSLATIRQIASEATPPRPGRQRGPRTPSSMSDSEWLATWALGIFVAAGLYLKWRLPILVGISALAVTITLTTIFSLWRMSRAAVVANDRRFKLIVACLAAATFTGLLNVAWLLEPPSGGDVFRKLLDDYNSTGGFGSIGGLGFVVYQMTGALVYILVALMSIAFCLSIFTSINIYSNTFGQPLWRFAFRKTSPFWGGWILAGGIILAVVSLALCGGWAYSLVLQASTTQIGSLPSATP